MQQKNTACPTAFCDREVEGHSQGKKNSPSATKHSYTPSTLRSARKKKEKKGGARPQELATQTDASQPV